MGWFSRKRKPTEAEQLEATRQKALANMVDQGQCSSFDIDDRVQTEVGVNEYVDPDELWREILTGREQAQWSKIR